jgi:Family of unknown function (DUF6502)
MKDRQQELLIAMQRCLEPIAAFLLEAGVSYKDFKEIAKVAFVKAATLRSGNDRRMTNMSRIAVSTGLSRKEVARLKERLDADLKVVPEFGSPAAMVLAGWHTDERFVDELGRPLPLPTENGERSFSHLVRVYAGDVTPGAVRSELARAGAIEITFDGLLIPTKRHFVPSEVDAKLLSSIGIMLYGLANTIAHNANPARKGSGRIQRFVYSDLLEPAAIRLFRNVARHRAAEFLENLDDWLGSNQFPLSDSSDPDHKLTSRVGVGVYYFEEATNASDLPLKSHGIGKDTFQAD